MSFDIAILDNEGKPEVQVGMNSNEHYDLIQKAKEIKLNIFLQLSEYYEDVNITPSEVQTFKDEIQILGKSYKENNLHLITTNLIDLCNKALEMNRGLSAIAD
ncbi:MAG: hypothetical protein OCD02_00200 [Spirochaetaceae bacterium]